MYGGYGSICKRNKHQPGSLLYYSLSGSSDSPQRSNLSRVAPASETSNRFYPQVPERSLAYRYDGINMDTPNSNAEFTSSCSAEYMPRYNRGQRKDEGTQGCTSCFAPKARGETRKLDPILDPKFNLREVAKHMILLEDHLFQPGRRCDDCINKHRLTLEAFLEEAITLDKTGEHRKIIEKTLQRFKQIMKEWVEKVRRNPVANVDEVYFTTAQKLREVRKPLCMAYCDFC